MKDPWVPNQSDEDFLRNLKGIDPERLKQYRRPLSAEDREFLQSMSDTHPLSPTRAAERRTSDGTPPLYSESQIESFLKEGETQRREFKSKWTSSVWNTVCAFANTDGGEIWIGVNERSRNVVGADARKLEAQIRSGIMSEFRPTPPQVQVLSIRYQDLELAIIQVQKATQYVFRADGKSFVRQGASDVKSREAPAGTDGREGSDSLRPSDAPPISVSDSATSTEAGTSSAAQDAAQTDADTNQTVGADDVQKAAEPNKPVDRAAAYGSLLKPSREATDDEACLNVNQYAAVLATLFESAPSTERFCFGLFGHWGRGKTYLMQRVARVLQQRGYATVNFSAWKFRTTPEVWAHLYESVYSAASRSNRLFPIRLNVTRHGFWPAVVALAMVNVAMLPLGDRVQLLSWLLNALGVAVCIYVLMLYARLRPVFVRLRDMYMTVPRHGDKLGLQFAIGEDFKSLLKAWVPRPGVARPAPTTWATWFQYLFARSPWWTWWQFGGFVALVVVACLLGVQVYLAGTARAGTPTWGQVVMQVATFGLPAFIIGLPLIAIEWPTAQAKRALLIVDDLDRCPADQMLDIVECLQLFLDDDAVASRLQVCMMIEDEILQAALHKKYGRYFAKHGSDGGAPQAPALQERLRRRVIEENLEKLFLIHLRLAPVGTPELQEIMRRYCRPRVSAPKKPASQTESDELTGGLGVPPAAEAVGLAELGRLLDPDDQSETPVRAEERPPIVDSELTADEAKLLEEAVPQFEPSSYAGRWGPRSVRKFVLRYQLARMLLKEFRQPVNPQDLIHELLRPPEDNARRVDDAHPLLRAVVRQVT